MNSATPESIVLDFVVSEEAVGQRLDIFLAAHLPTISRTTIRRSITAGEVFVNGTTAKPSYHVSLGEHISGSVTLPLGDAPVPENIPLEILHDDDDIVAVNKPAGMVVHPAKGHWAGTLTSALAYRFDRLSSRGGANRPGIVHRLDRDTSGVILIAKNDRAHAGLAHQFERRLIQKEYFAVTRGAPNCDRDLIEQPIGMHPYQREKMAIRVGHSTSRAATTLYEVEHRFRGFASLRVFPKTGRTHQIRVHLSHVGCPVVCDRLYAGHAAISISQLGGDREDSTIVLDRQALHARRIAFAHPITGEPLTIEAPLANDLQHLVDTLRQLADR